MLFANNASWTSLACEKLKHTPANRQHHYSFVLIIRMLLIVKNKHTHTTSSYKEAWICRTAWQYACVKASYQLVVAQKILSTNTYSIQVERLFSFSLSEQSYQSLQLSGPKKSWYHREDRARRPTRKRTPISNSNLIIMPLSSNSSSYLSRVREVRGAMP